MGSHLANSRDAVRHSQMRTAADIHILFVQTVQLHRGPLGLHGGMAGTPSAVRPGHWSRTGRKLPVHSE